MATKDKKSTTKKTAEPATKVTRIKANDSAPKKKAAPAKVTTKKVAALASPKNENSEEKTRNPFKATGRYFAGAWFELKQVRWPNRKATWSLTAAVLVFTAFFAVLILLLDALFKYLFQLILG